MDDHRPNTAYRAGFKRLVDDDGVPLKIDSATDYIERKHGTTDRVDALTEYMVLPEAFKRDVCKGFEAASVAALLRSRGHLIHERDRLTVKHRLPGIGKAPVYHIKTSVFDDELCC